MIAKRKNLAREKQLKSYFDGRSRRNKLVYFKRDDSKDSLILPIVLGVLFVAVIGFLVISNWRVSKKRTDLETQIKSLQEQLKTLEDKKVKLEAGISVGESQVFLEEQAREKLGLKKHGEEVVTVLPPKETAQNTTQQNKSLWQRILQKLGF